MIHCIEISLKSFEYKLLQNARSQIVSITPHFWKQSQIMLPLKRKKFTVLRSPHIDKKSREQFELKYYKNVLKIFPNQSVFDSSTKSNNEGGNSLQDVDFPFIGFNEVQTLKRHHSDILQQSRKEESISRYSTQLEDRDHTSQYSTFSNQATLQIVKNKNIFSQEMEKYIFIENVKHMLFTGVQIQVQILYKSFLYPATKKNIK